MHVRDRAADRGVRLLLLEPDRWRRSGLVTHLSSSGFQVLTDREPGLEPEVVLANLAWRGPEVRDSLERLSRELDDPHVVAFVEDLGPEMTFPSLRLRVKGFLPVDATPEEVHSALCCVIGGSLWAPRSLLSRWVDQVSHPGSGTAGDFAFTRAEKRVLAGVLDELSNKEIGHRLGITESTVKFHVGKLLKKTGTATRLELARRAAAGLR